MQIIDRTTSYNQRYPTEIAFKRNDKGATVQSFVIKSRN